MKFASPKILSKKTRCEIFACLVRPVIEYAAAVYEHMLNGDLSEDIERMQRMSLKTIFGRKVSYESALDQSGLPRMDTRRKKLALEFALKCEENPRYKRWFPPHPTYDHNVRAPLKYTEMFASKDRLKNSPVFRMRKILNEHYATEKKLSHSSNKAGDK